MERQRPVYEKLSANRPWGANKEVRQVLDRLWKGVPTGLRLDDKYMLMLEENPVEPLDEPWTPTAACMIAASLALIHAFHHKDKQAAEMAFQSELCQRLCEIPNKDKTAFIAQCQKASCPALHPCAL